MPSNPTVINHFVENDVITYTCMASGTFEWTVTPFFFFLFLIFKVQAIVYPHSPFVLTITVISLMKLVVNITI